MRENYKPSHVWVDENKMIEFDILIVQTKGCEAVYTAFGDSAHVIQSAYRFIMKDGCMSEYGKSSYALHCGELEKLVRNSANEVLAILDGKVVYHTVKGKIVEV